MASEEIKKQAKQTEAYKRLKKEVSRKSSLANKRLVRLEKNNLTELPAYKQWLTYKGGAKFSVAGKDYRQLQSELARVDRFINAETSLVRQANAHMKHIASMTGTSYGSVKELPKKLKNFFEIASKVEQYLRNVDNSASAIGYHKIWEVMNKYVETEQIDLADSQLDVDGILQPIIELTYLDIDKDRIKTETFDWWEI